MSLKHEKTSADRALIRASAPVRRPRNTSRARGAQSAIHGSAFGGSAGPGSLALATLGALALSILPSLGMARPKVPSPDSPFSGIPSHLKTTTTTEQKPLRPLLIWQIGPGGSFADDDSLVIDGKTYDESRWLLAKRLLKKYTKKYGNKIQWALYIDTEEVNGNSIHVKRCGNRGRNSYNCDRNQSVRQLYDFFEQTYHDNLNYLRFITSVRVSDWYVKEGRNVNRAGLWGDYNTFMKRMNKYPRALKDAPFRPLSLNYTVQSVVLHRANIRYRCQPAFYVVVDDGYQYGHGMNAMSGATENAVYGMFELAKDGINPYPWKKLQIRSFCDANTLIYKKKWGRFGWDWVYDGCRKIKNYDYACMTLFESNRKSGDWFRTDPPTDGSCGMRFFSNTLAHSDLMRQGHTDRPTDDAGKSWDDPAFPKQSMETFAIRINTDAANDFGEYSTNNNAAQSYFRMKGIASKNEYFYDVKNGEQFKHAFDSIISTVEKSIVYGKVKAYSTVSPALGAPEATPVPGSAANIRLNMFEGSSEIRFHDVETDYDKDKFKDLKQTGDKAELDKAASYTITVDAKKYTLPLFSERTPLFETDGKAYLFNQLDRANLDNDDFDVPDSSNPYRQEWRDALLKWVTRTVPDQQIHDEPDNRLLYRVRKKDASFDNYSMGDIIDTPVLDIGQYLTTAANDGMVYVFKKKEVANPVNNKKENRFSLKLNYLPLDAAREDDDDTLMRHYKFLPDPEYAQNPSKPHQYMINGGMVWRLTAPSFNDSRNLIIAGTYGQGGRGAYALRVAGNELDSDETVGIESRVDQWSQKVPLFTVDGDKYDHLGYTFGDPQIGQLSNHRITHFDKDEGFSTEFSDEHYKYAMFLSSGFNNPEDGVDRTESALYVFNVFDQAFGGKNRENLEDPGKLLKKIRADEHGGGLAQSTLVDLDNDGITDIAYAGDYNGNLYRFDFKNGIDRATAVKIFRTPTGQHFTSAPGVMKVMKKGDSGGEFASGKMMVVIGTGSDIYEDDSNDKTTLNAVYGIEDDVSVASPSVLTIDKLKQQTFTAGYTGKDRRGVRVRTRNGSEHELGNFKGWYMNLSENTGERVITKPIVYDGMALVTTRIYTASKTESTSNNNTNTGPEDPCVASEKTQKFTGTGWVMQFDARTGGKPREFDYKSSERQAAYIDFMGHLENSKNPIVSGVMEPGAGIPNITMSGDKPVLDNLQVVKGVKMNNWLQMDSNFEGDVGGSGVTGNIPNLKETKKTEVKNYNLHDMKYEREKIVPALFVSTSIKGLQDPYTLAIKHIPNAQPQPAGQTQILKRLSYKVLE